MKKFNINEFIWFVILALLWLTIFLIYKSSLIYNYVGNKSEKLILIALLLLGAICINQLIRSFSFPTRENIKFGNFVFILCLILILSNKGKYVASFIDIKGITLVENTEEGHNRGSEEFWAKKENIEIKDNLHDFIHAFNDEDEKLKGKRISVEGTVYKSKDLDGAFIIAKQEINCCAADAQNIGILCKSQLNIKQGELVRVDGILDGANIEFRDQKGKAPIINVDKVTIIKQ